MAIGTSLYDEEGPPVWILASAGFRDYTYLKALGFRAKGLQFTRPFVLEIVRTFTSEHETVLSEE